MTDVLEILGRVAQASSVDAVWDIALPFYRGLGFSRVNYGFTRFRHEKGLGVPADAIYLSSNTPDYARLYFNDGFYAKTPMFRWVMENEGVCTWRWVEEAYLAGQLSPAEAEAVRTNLAMDVKAGLSISFPETSPRQKGALGLIADVGLGHDDVDAIWDRSGSELMAIANMMHLKITQLPLVTRRRPLTDRQREALEWVADGKTTQDIATIMGVSTAMVEKHLRLAREALDVETTAQAVAKGALLNMIFQRPPATGQELTER